jgi:hypothetical protein
MIKKFLEANELTALNIPEGIIDPTPIITDEYFKVSVSESIKS